MMFRYYKFGICTLHLLFCARRVLFYSFEMFYNQNIRSNMLRKNGKGDLHERIFDSKISAIFA